MKIKLKRKLFTFADQETWKEIEKVLKGDHKIGDLTNAKDAVVMGKLMRKIANSLDSVKTVKINITDEDKDILRKIGMPASADNLEHFLNKYNNKELKDRWGRMYGKKLDKTIEEREEWKKNPVEKTEKERKALRKLKKDKKDLKYLEHKYDKLTKEYHNMDWDDPSRAEKGKERNKVFDETSDKRHEVIKGKNDTFDVVERRIQRYSVPTPLEQVTAAFKSLKNLNPFKLNSGKPSPLDIKIAKQLKEKAKKEGLTINENQSSLSCGYDYIDLTKEDTNNPETIGHELGHKHDKRANPDEKHSDRGGFFVTKLLDPEKPGKLRSKDAINNIRNQFANALRIGAEESQASYRGSSIVRQAGKKNPNVDHLKACGQTYNSELGMGLLPMIHEIERRKEKVNSIPSMILSKAENTYKNFISRLLSRKKKEKEIEKAFCEGYLLAQKEFNSKESKRLNNELAIQAFIDENGEDNACDYKEKLRKGRIILKERQKDNPYEGKVGYEDAVKLRRRINEGLDDFYDIPQVNQSVIDFLRKTDRIDKANNTVTKEKDDIKNRITKRCFDSRSSDIANFLIRDRNLERRKLAVKNFLKNIFKK